jgi:hypothetical protein
MITLSDTHTHTHICRNPLEEGSARRRDLYLTTPNTQKEQTFVPPAGLEPAIVASERSQTCALEPAANEIGKITICLHQFVYNNVTA